jgi:luciferase family oxidoreductase group 1
MLRKRWADPGGRSISCTCLHLVCDLSSFLPHPYIAETIPTRTIAMTRYSILDLAPVPEGARPGDALRNTIDLARHADKLGYTRYWLAEHHNMVGIASAATAVVIGQVAAATNRIRVGAGGIMLPNHAPLVIAEQFGTLAELFPGRIDLGLGRAPGTDQMTLRALRVNPMEADRFPDDVLELQALLADPQLGQTLRAVPGFGTNVPLWILGSSLFGAQLAAAFGLPYAFASHFAPGSLMQAFEVYRAQFKPSQQLARPYAMAGINVIAAGTDAEASRLFTSAQQRATGMVRGMRGYLPPPINDIDTFWSPSEKAQVSRMLACSIVGGPETLRRGLEAFIARTGADELMVAAAIFDHAARVRSYAILDEVARDLGLATRDLAA